MATAKKKPQPPAEVASIDDAREARELLKQIQEARAELEAARSEIEALRAQAASGKAGNGREVKRAAWLAPIPEAKMAKADTTRGKLERLDRADIIQAGYKALHRVRMADLPAMLEAIADKAAEGGGMYGDTTAEAIVGECLEVRGRAKRSKKGK